MPASQSFAFNEDNVFIHFQDNRESVVLLHSNEEVNTYYRLTFFGADVVGYIQDHPNSTFEQISAYLANHYEAKPEKIELELKTVISKLKENSLI
mgnify:CR=1 FL=1